MPRKKSKKNYFTQEVEDAIVEFNNSESIAEKNRLFANKIYPALDKLIENVINTGKFYNYETSYTDLKQEVVTFCYRKLSRYKPEAGKAFSYFNRVARNELISKSKAYTKQKSNKDDVNAIDDCRDLNLEFFREKIHDQVSDFMDLWISWVDRHLEKLFTNQHGRKAADAILEMFRSRELIENFNKKSLYVLMRSHSGVKAQYITSTKNIMKKMYYEMYSDYCNGDIDWNYYLRKYTTK